MLRNSIFVSCLLLAVLCAPLVTGYSHSLSWVSSVSRISTIGAVTVTGMSTSTGTGSGKYRSMSGSAHGSGTKQLHSQPHLDCELTVNLEDRSYPIYIGRELISSQAGDILARHVDSKKVLIVTNTKIGPLYTQSIKDSLARLKPQTEVFVVELPDGEEYKTMDVLMQIIDASMDARLDRKSTMIALGGGVVGDMTGFAAAIYLRGIKFIQVPTSLMAMVDSAVGGKTAVNHPKGKNMIGAFYQPDAVIVDTNSLSTLPDREFRSGLSEVIKYGLIRDSQFFEWLEENMSAILRRDPAALAEVVRRSCANKAAVVASDEKESHGGLRATLNLGHTFGHAVESGMGYGSWLHGEAVAVGTQMAAEMSQELGWVTPDLVARVRALLVQAGLPVTLANPHADAPPSEPLTVEGFLDLMAVDKKVANGQLNLILLKGPLGECVVTDKFDPAVLERTVRRFVVAN